MKTKYAISERGRSIVEMLGVLCLMGVITMIAMKWWAKAMDNQRANAIESEIEKRAALFENRTAGKTKFVTQNMYNDTEKMVYGYGITPVQNAGDHLEIQVGGVNDGRGIAKTTCELLLSRQSVIEDGDGHQRANSPIYRWRIIRDGEDVISCSDNVTMIAMLKAPVAVRDENNVVPRQNVFNDQCQTSTDCPTNQECRHKICVQCPAGYFRAAGQGTCVAGCQLTFKGSVTNQTENLCKKCDATTGQLVNKNNGEACGPADYGKCDGNTCDMCALWDTNASAQAKACGKCSAGQWVENPSKNGQSCFNGRGTCSGRYCTCDPTRYWIPNKPRTIDVTDCVCRPDTRRTASDSNCICDKNRGLVDNKEATCRCAQGWTLTGDGTCAKCSQTSYKDWVGDSRENGCSACDNKYKNSITGAVGATSSGECKCPPGTYLKDGKTCTACSGKWTGSNEKSKNKNYTSSLNTDSSCTDCGKGFKAVSQQWTVGQKTGTGFTGCKACNVDDGDGFCGCDANKKPYGQSSGCSECSDNSACQTHQYCDSSTHKCVNKTCGNGKYVIPRPATDNYAEPTCGTCAAGKYKDGTNTAQSCNTCPGNTHAPNTGSTSSQCYQCTGTHPNANTSHTKCDCTSTSCGSGKYCDSNKNCQNSPSCGKATKLNSSGSACTNCTSSDGYGGCGCASDRYPSGGKCCKQTQSCPKGGSINGSGKCQKESCNTDPCKDAPKNAHGNRCCTITYDPDTDTNCV